MPQLRFRDRTLPLSGETVLERLLAEGISVPNSCRAGVCQSCLLRACEGTPPPAAQQGLKDSWRARGYFLACVARPTEDLTIQSEDEESLLLPVELSEKDWLTPSVLRLRFVSQAPFPYQPGQYASLVAPSGLVRSYSLASLPTEPFFEFHVRILPDGRMSSWLRELPVGARAQLRGPAGECFYVPGRPAQPLLLVGVGTGLAPLYGVLREALRAEHQGPIVLIHGAKTPHGLYLRRELSDLAKAHPQLTYHPVVLSDEGTPDDEGVVRCEVAPLEGFLKSRFAKLAGQRAFLCGDAELVGQLRRQVFLQGCSRKDILADAFVISDTKSQSTV